jgi:hypothetical protein
MSVDAQELEKPSAQPDGSKVIALQALGVSLLAKDTAPPVRLRMLRDVLRRPACDVELAQAVEELESSHWVLELGREQWSDGSWGRLHSRDCAAGQKIPTTEAGVERALALGLTAEHPILHRAVQYLAGVLEGASSYRDRAEKNDRWPTGVRLFAAATLAQIAPQQMSLDREWSLWSEILGRSFAGGAYDPRAQAQAHRALTGASAMGSYLVLCNKYAVTLLGARAEFLPKELEAEFVGWLWSLKAGVGYLGEPLHGPPRPPKPSTIDRWMQSQELLSQFPTWCTLASGVMEWLWEQRIVEGWWDLGPRASTSLVLPLSDSWRTKKARALDWSTRVMALLSRFEHCDQVSSQLSMLDVDVHGLQGPTAPRDQQLVIRRIRLAHCKRGPEQCAECRRMSVERLCLLDVRPPGAGEIQRRVIQLRVDGETEWREFDVLRSFRDESEAREYASAHKIQDAEYD